MATRTIKSELLHVAMTTDQWQQYATTVQAKGKLLIEFAIGGVTRLKASDGISTWSELPYIGGDANLSDYYTKEETDSEISKAIASIGNVMTVKGTIPAYVDLPMNGNKQGDVWFVGTSTENENNSYDEYVWMEAGGGSGGWEFIGTTGVDLSGYATITYLNSQISEITNRLNDTDLRVQAIEMSCLKSTDKLIMEDSLNG